ncbi:hypothetical protein [Micromonospora sonchi]|uniref:hypothetical protein n=1 Tax=Micromonospora sonchi TaxID=1763543 RepID=UPI0016629032
MGSFGGGVFGRRLRGWVPGVLGRARRGTVALMCGADDGTVAEEALRVVGEYADRLRGCRITVLVLTDDAGDLPTRLGALEAGLPPEVAVHLMPGPPSRLPVALRAAGASGAPVLSYLAAEDAVDPVALSAATTGRPAEALLLAGAGVALRPALADAGFPLSTEVELADTGRRVGFGTGSDRSLEAVKEELWAAGQRLLDPYGMPLSPAPEVDPAPLARALLTELTCNGPGTVTELRRYAVTATAYRAVDALRALTALLDAGRVSRAPEQGRLGGDVLVTAVPSAA